MILSKNLNKNGFTFIEVALAITIIGFGLTNLLSLQGTIIKRSSSYFQKINNILVSSSLLVENNFKKTIKEKITTEKFIKDPQITLKQYEKEINEKSDLKNFQKDINIVEVEAEWKDNFTIKKEKIITFAYKNKEEKSEK